MVHVRGASSLAALGGAAAAWPLAAHGQHSSQPRIGCLVAYAADQPEGRARGAPFKAGLEEFWWINDRSINIEYRWAARTIDQVRDYATELIGLDQWRF
jgi:hypothetical protein